LRWEGSQRKNLGKLQEKIMRQVDLCHALFEIITKQEEVVNEQNKLIAKLTNENLEQENMINTLMQYEIDAQ
jgi:hypothetical protein